MKYRIIKREGAICPYQVQMRTWYGMWRPLSVLAHWAIYVDNEYKTFKEAEEALDRFLRRHKKPEVIKEVEA